VIIRIDASAALPVYEQIREQITRMAVVGTLAPEARLPTIRQLAADLGIAKGTVAKAYALLESSAVVESRGHRGTFVRETGASTDDERAAVDLNAAADSYVVAARQTGNSLEHALAAVRLAWNQI